MSPGSFVGIGALAAALCLSAPPASASITIPTVPVGNVGNAADPTPNGPFGSVSYSYAIATTEVTNAQYAAFLNAVASTDTNGLYNTNMAGSFGGITRSGSSGSYAYAVVPGRASNPVNYVSFWDAARFANWLHNGQPTGAQSNSTTEDGAYTLTPGGISANSVTRNGGWLWAVTSSHEWYKAAYHQPASAGGDSDDYWLYTTSSNSAPTIAQANFGGIGDTTPVGSYAPNHYGTFDMGGNVWEWNEAIFFVGSEGLYRGLRGGSWLGVSDDLEANTQLHDGLFANDDDFMFGFRVTQVPGPSSVALLGLGALASFRGARRRR